MNLDDKIKQALKMDETEVNQILNSNDGLLSRFSLVLSGSMKGWNIFGVLLSFILAGLMFWCGYQFFASTTTDDRVFWGFLTLATIVMSMGIKIWLWMELNRISTIREIKRVELAVAQLIAKLYR
ncbi:MAG: hypothetical protein HWE27_13870 [Gammaproteobacteria bacterium]|nr:hypothetical protein [Gammaproteobacteria bacterium]